jgi:hypothetical protein
LPKSFRETLDLAHPVSHSVAYDDAMLSGQFHRHVVEQRALACRKNDNGPPLPRFGVSDCGAVTLENSLFETVHSHLPVSAACKLLSLT